MVKLSVLNEIKINNIILFVYEFKLLLKLLSEYMVFK